MRAGLRWRMALLAGGLLVAAARALAQTVPDTTSNTPATDAVGPRELQNFSLPGTTTRPAEQPATSAPANRPAARETSTESRPAATATPVRREPARQAAREPAPAAPQPAQPTPTPRTSVVSPSPAPVAAAPETTAPQPSLAAPAPDTSTAVLAPEHKLPILPWLIAALVLVAGTIFMLWRRNHQREAVAGGQEYDLFVAPEPAPAPPPRAAAPAPQPAARPAPPQPAPPPRSSGIVASRLRPALELDMQPLRCLFDEEQVTIEFEVELFNSGTAPARAVIAEASLFNASAGQEQELAAFYARPPAADGDRIDSIPPMRRMSFTNRVVAPRAAVQEYELAGRKSFVPVLAFNAQYEWSGGKGQSSLAFLLGRETRSDKLGPLHLDGSREVRGLGARVLPNAVRT